MQIVTKEEFADQIIIPVIEYLIFKILQYQHRKMDENILFITREGFYLQQIYNKMIARVPELKEAQLLYSSRYIATRVLNKSYETYLCNLKLHRYSGTCGEFIKERLNIDPKVAEERYGLSTHDLIDTQSDLRTFKILFKALKPEIEEESRRLQEELRLQICDPYSRYTTVDFGIHGTVQRSLLEINKNISGLYLIGSRANIWRLNNYESITTEDIFLWDRLGAVFESIFTAPYGTVKDLDAGRVKFKEYTPECEDVIFRETLISIVSDKILHSGNIFNYHDKKLEFTLANKAINVGKNFNRKSYQFTNSIKSHFYFENEFIRKNNQKLLEV